MTPEALSQLLQSVAQGQTSPSAALAELKHFSLETLGDFAQLDHHRRLRTGFPEAVWGPGKSPEQIQAILTALAARNPVVMATRIENEIAQELMAALPGLRYYPSARICALIQGEITPQYPGVIGVLSAGTADLAVAEEAATTATLSGFEVERLWDVGVAGLHRLLRRQALLQSLDVLIVVAGMEGALPSVVAGLVEVPVIAVPTSIGYGAHFGGLAPLLTMLNSCATGIGVVNIDNGFGAAMLAGQILRVGARLSPSK